MVYTHLHVANWVAINSCTLVYVNYLRPLLQSSGVKEVELTELKKVNKGSSVQAFALVDDGTTYGIKVYAILCTSLPSQYLQVVIVTPTSKAEAMYMLPIEDWSTVTLIAGSSEVSSCYGKNISTRTVPFGTWVPGLYIAVGLSSEGCSEGFHEIINRESFLQVMVNSSFTVSWSVPRASKNDKIGSYL